MGDTRAEAIEVQDAVIRRLSGAERLRLAMEMSDAVRDMVLARIRREHPDWGEPEVLAGFMRETIPPDALPTHLR